MVMYVHVHRSRKAFSIARYQILTRNFLSEQLYSRVGAIMEHNDRGHSGISLRIIGALFIKRIGCKKRIT